mmetsp:Transcript_15711/g.35370  ORF Transcript_15711/g.35370 Transcript_15711/m.35370 type:complete len:81 (+) Transcript_15711:1129-1371(+)
MRLRKANPFLPRLYRSQIDSIQVSLQVRYKKAQLEKEYSEYKEIYRHKLHFGSSGPFPTLFWLHTINDDEMLNKTYTLPN